MVDKSCGVVMVLPGLFCGADSAPVGCGQRERFRLCTQAEFSRLDSDRSVEI
jgi:hypothetical protein